MTYNKQKDGVWGCTDAQSAFVRSIQTQGVTQKEVNEVVKGFRKVNEK